MRVVFTVRAQDRLAEIEAFVAERSPKKAAKLVEKLINKGESLDVMPRRGRVVPEIGSEDVRELIDDVYRIVYRVVGDELVEIITIFDARREHFPFADVTDD